MKYKSPHDLCESHFFFQDTRKYNGANKKVYLPGLFPDVCATRKENGCTTWLCVCVSLPFLVYAQRLSYSVPPISPAFVSPQFVTEDIKRYE